MPLLVTMKPGACADGIVIVRVGFGTLLGTVPVRTMSSGLVHVPAAELTTIR